VIAVGDSKAQESSIETCEIALRHTSNDYFFPVEALPESIKGCVQKTSPDWRLHVADSHWPDRREKLVNKHLVFERSQLGELAMSEMGSRVENRRSGFSLPVAVDRPFAPSPQSGLAWLCFLFSLIEPDRRISRIRLSEKVSRLRPRKAARPSSKFDKAQHLMQGSD
jgi:hypothetical protein